MLPLCISVLAFKRLVTPKNEGKRSVLSNSTESLRTHLYIYNVIDSIITQWQSNLAAKLKIIVSLWLEIMIIIVLIVRSIHMSLSHHLISKSLMAFKHTPHHCFFTPQISVNANVRGKIITDYFIQFWSIDLSLVPFLRKFTDLCRAYKCSSLFWWRSDCAQESYTFWQLVSDCKWSWWYLLYICFTTPCNYHKT